MEMSGMTIKAMALIARLFTDVSDAGIYTERDVFCATQNVWHEARGLPREEWIAVTNVVINRSKDRKLSICEVVRQDAPNKRAQFSWTDDGKSDLIDNGNTVRLAGIIISVMATMRGVYGDTTNGALWYHAKSMKKKPKWAKRAKGKELVGHVYYSKLEK